MELSDIWGLRFQSKPKTKILVDCPSCGQNNFILKPGNSTKLFKIFNVSLRSAFCNNPSCNDRSSIQVAYDPAAKGFIDWAKWTIDPNNIMSLHQKANELNAANPFPESTPRRTQRLIKDWLALNPEEEV